MPAIEELQSEQHEAEWDKTCRDLSRHLQDGHCRLVQDGRADQGSAAASADGKRGGTHSGEVGITTSEEAVCGDASAEGSGGGALRAVAARVGGENEGGFSDTQLRALGGRLHARHVRSRLHGDLEIRYIEGWLAIREANRIFGYGGWSRETSSMSCIYVKPDGGRFTACYMARVRIQVAAGRREVVREGTGLGQGSGDTPGLAHEFAAKAAETDATKRALATFGARFGLELAATRGSKTSRRKGESDAPEADDPSTP